MLVHAGQAIAGRFAAARACLLGFGCVLACFVCSVACCLLGCLVARLLGCLLSLLLPWCTFVVAVVVGSETTGDAVRCYFFVLAES